MSRCTRFESEGLLALERGDALDAHFATCEDCLAEHAAYRALLSGLEETAGAYRPPRDFEARVWARIATQRRTEPPWYRRWWWQLGVPALAAASLLVVWWVYPGEESGPAALALQVTVRAGEDRAVMRGDSVKPGDVLVIRATVGDDPNAELRVYRGARDLHVSCTRDPPCRRRSGGITAEVALAVRGDYHVVLVVSDQPIPPPGRSLDEDIAAVEESGGRIERGELVRVR